MQRGDQPAALLPDSLCVCVTLLECRALAFQAVSTSG
jgi:hypothetical protein